MSLMNRIRLRPKNRLLTSRIRAAAPRAKLFLKSLEDRCVPALITVMNNNDSNVGSLRAALTTAQANGFDDTITFDNVNGAGLIGASATITLTTGELVYAASEGKALTITWPGAGKLTVQSSGAAAANRRVFNFSDTSGAPDSVQINLSKLVITGGNLSTGNNGAGILDTNESLTLTNCDITGNTTVSNGGAIATIAGATGTPTFMFNGCTVTNNVASAGGGGLELLSSVSVIINSSTFSSNATSSTGGAINVVAPFTMNVTGSTFSGNTAISGGAAIFMGGPATTTITMNTSSFSSNFDTGANPVGGGAIQTNGNIVTMTATDCTFSLNQGPYAGCFYIGSASHTITLNRCTVTGNTATALGGGGVTIATGGPFSSFTANYSTFSNNVATTSGGAISSGSRLLTLTNCTVSGNEARGSSTFSAGAGGGGISLDVSGASLVLNNTTVAYNRATGAAGIYGGVGGGIRRDQNTGILSGTITLQSSIVAANTSINGGPDIDNNTTNTPPIITIGGGDNLIGVADVGSFTLSGTNQTGTSGAPLDPRLAPLANNGGTTLTHAFRFDSPAIDKGDNLAMLTLDQRGSPRVDGVAGVTDVGAVEGKLLVPFVDGTAGITDVSSGSGTTYGFTVTFNDETGINTAKLGTGEVTVTGPSGFFNVTPAFMGFTTGAGNKINAKYQFTPPGGSWDTMDGGTYSVNLVANKLFDTDVPTPHSGTAGTIGTFNVGIAGSIVVDTTAEGDDGNVLPGKVSLREAVRISNANTLVMNGGTDTITFSPSLNGTTISLTTGQIAVTADVTILGPGAGLLTVNGAVAASATNRIFNINVAGYQAYVDISGLTLANGNLNAGNGGAILNADEFLTLTGVTFINNKTAGTGGAISNTAAAAMTLDSCTFTGNSATSSGGAVFFIGSLANGLTVTSSTFTSNTSGSSGGAINGSGSLGVSGSTFTGNTAKGAGGAIFGNTTTTLTVSGSTLSGNSAASTGGAIDVGSNSTVTLTTTTLSSNTGTSGGGIYFSTGGTLTSDSSTLNNNVASAGGGGGIRFAAYSFAATNNLTITSSTISGNTASTGTGGGILISAAVGAASATLTVANSTIANNSATGNGGGVFFTGSANTAQFDSTIVAGNNTGATNHDLSGSDTVTPQTISGYNNLFGAVDPAIITVAGSNQYGSEGSPLDAQLSPLGNYGGPTQTMELAGTSPAIDTGSNVNNYGYDQRGFPRVVGAGPDIGALESQGQIPGAKATLPNVTTAAGIDYVATVVYTDKTAINTATIDKNDVTLSGGNYGSPVAPTSVTFSGGPMTVTALYHFTPPGGSWDFLDGGMYTLNMVANQVKNSGGASVLPGSLGTFTVNISHTFVVDTLSDVDNGNYGPGDLSLREAVRLSSQLAPGGTDTITFAPALNGGTISLLAADGGQMAISQPVVIQGPGSGLLTVAGAAAASTTNRIFNINIAAPSSTVTISGLTLTSGNVSGSGGAINLVDEALSLTDVKFTGNKASATGGAINASTATSITLTNCTFTGNSATGAGGGVSMLATTGASTLTVSGSSFTNNTSSSSGGAINGGSTVTFNVSNSAFSGNSATSSGGAISIATNGSTSSISSSTFTGNKSSSSGGSIAINTSSGTLPITDSTISGGSSGAQGGGIRFSSAAGATLSLTRCTVSGNICVLSGGGLYVPSATLNVTDSTISGNTVTGSVGGGGIFTYTGTINITNSTISGNAASGALVLGGGGIRVSGGTLTIDNSTITGNSAASSAGAGGIATDSAASVITINSSIVAQNIAPTHPDIGTNPAAVLTVAVNDSIIGASTDANVTLTLSNSTAGTFNNPINAKLGPLTNNGGPTQTHALAYGSPAINHGSNNLALNYDQRGVGYARVVGGTADIGAFEGLAPIPQAFSTQSNVTTGGGTSFTVSVLYVDDVGINTSTIDLNDITVTTPSAVVLHPISKSISGSGQSVTVNYVFTPPNGSWSYADGGNYTVAMVGGQVADVDATPHTVPAGTLGTFSVLIPASLVVDIANDTNDNDLTPGHVSLRNAVTFANKNAGATDSITFAPALSGQTLTLTLGQIGISDSINIHGPGADKLKISGNNASRIFAISDGSIVNHITTTISDVTLMSGHTAGGGSAISQNGDTLNLTNCVVSGNTSDQYGGALYMWRLASSDSPTLNASNCAFVGNKASNGNGGAVDASVGSAIITMTNCTLSGNSASLEGGAVAIGYAAADFNNCTISGNTAKDGGGLAVFYAAAVVTNSTISGNSATAYGGGVFVQDGSGGATASLTVRNSTVTANTATTTGGGIVANFGFTGVAYMDSSIVAGNINGVSPDWYFPIAKTINGDYNLIGALDVSNASFTGSNILSGTQATPLDAMLGALTYNGGLTQTIALLPGSPAINMGSNTLTLTHDQRGNARSVGLTDIGAYEVQAPAKFSSVVINNGDAQRSMVTQVKVTLNQHIGFSGAAAAAFTLKRVSDSASVTLNAAVDDSGSGTAVTLTFTGGAVNNKSLADGRYALHILASGFNAEGFDGDGNGIAAGSPTDDYAFDEPAAPATLDAAKIFRIFGDVNGDGAVATNDFVAFRQSFNGVNDLFDFDGDGFVSTSDFVQFRQRFNTSI
jgi:fibronectin-binding autotransporter adhesin